VKRRKGAHQDPLSTPVPGCHQAKVALPGNLMLPGKKGGKRTHEAVGEGVGALKGPRGRPSSEERESI